MESMENEQEMRYWWYQGIRGYWELDSIPEPEDLTETVDWLWNKVWDFERDSAREEYQDRETSDRIGPRVPQSLSKTGLEPVYGAEGSVDILEILAFGYRAWKERKSARIERVRGLQDQMEEHPEFVVSPDGLLLHCDFYRRNVELPPYVTAIRRRLFWPGPLFEKITIPDGVWFIGVDTLSGCTSLRHVEIPESVEIIQCGAFSDSTGLEELRLPCALRALSTGAFQNCGIRTIQIHCDPLVVYPIWEDRFRRPSWYQKTRPRLYLHRADTDLERLPTAYRMALIEGFLYGDKAEARFTKAETDMFRSYLRRHAVALWRKGDPSMQQALLWEQVLDERAYRAVQKDGVAEPKDHPELQASFLNYRFRALSAEELDRLEQQSQERQMRSLFQATITAKDVRRLWRCREKNGALEILAYRGTEPLETVTVPGRIGEKQVTAVHAFALGEDPMWQTEIQEKMNWMGRQYDSDMLPCRSWIGHTIRECNNHPDVRAAIRRIVVGEGILELESEAFAACRHAESIQLPDSLRRIGARCFFGCSALRDLIVPERLNSFGEDALLGCTALEVLVFSGRNTQVETGICDLFGQESEEITYTRFRSLLNCMQKDGRMPLIVGWKGPVQTVAERTGLPFVDLEQSWEELTGEQQETLMAFAARVRERGEKLPEALQDLMARR